MSVVGFLSALPGWVVALLLGLGPLGGQVLTTLGHGEVCACCAPSAKLESCCAPEHDASDGPVMTVRAGSCSCALVAPDGSAPLERAPRATEVPAGARGRLELVHRAVMSKNAGCAHEFVGTLVAWSSLAGPAPVPLDGRSVSAVAGTRRASGAERAAALGVLRL